MKRAKAVAPLREIPDHGTPVSLQHRNDGKALRERCPRSSHADLGRPTRSADDAARVQQRSNREPGPGTAFANDGVAIRVFSWLGHRAGKRFVGYAVYWHLRAALRRLPPDELRRFRNTRATADF